ncbi:MAG: hypothetical protein ACRCUT_06465, partial [Spirochaetota bacterium]
KPAAAKAPVKAAPSPAAVSAPAAPAAVPAPGNLSLMEISDGDFRYTRIQGMTFQKKAVMAADETSQLQAEDENSESGFSKSGWMMKGVVLLIIVIIFLLYKFGNKKRRGKVLRRFPK